MMVFLFKIIKNIISKYSSLISKLLPSGFVLIVHVVGYLTSNTIIYKGIDDTYMLSLYRLDLTPLPFH